ncbi:hypothetical protein BRARA_I03868 [Brassica rapa]|uniref:Sororin C-terminal region domain-containing protein n=1 Tax=Brassica campestris TaxID=3711 RepID=A0A397Y0X9_BRACM|nr:hypothetical protein BRARA_I03868 [Brassica rapa]
MEPHRPIARRLHRKPLGDCTNTISKTTKQQSSSSSSVVKFANPSLTSSLKRLVDQTSLKERNNNDVVDSSKAGPETASTSLRAVTRRVSADLIFPATTPSRPSKPKDVEKTEAAPTRGRPVTRRVCTDLGFPASAPLRRQNSRSGEGVGSEKEVAEPYSVYTSRRKASSGRKRSNHAVAANLRLDLISSPAGKKRRQANENTVKPSKLAPIKRQRTTKHEEDDLANGVSQDYIEKQRAYFAEIDAFELAEEEVSDSDLD